MVLVLALLAGGLLLGLSLRGRVVSYRSLSVDEGTFMFLYTYFRYRIPATFKAQGVKDTDSFWAAAYDDTRTNGDYYGELALKFVYQTIIAARLFDTESSLSATERGQLKELQEETLTLEYKGGGSKDTFNEKAKAYGFDYDDFCEGTLLLYKASKAQAALYGATGILADEADLNLYLKENYTCVKMIFVRTKDRFVLDEEGNYVFDQYGNYKTEAIPEEILAQKYQTIEALTADFANGITEAEFDALWADEEARYNDDSSCPAAGYYFSPTAEYTKAYAQAFPAIAEGEADIVSTALSLKAGQTAIVQSEYGTHFLYCAPIEDGDYKSTSVADVYAQMFSDFYENGASWLFTRKLTAEMENVKVRNKDFIAALDFAATKPNKELYIAF